MTLYVYSMDKSKLKEFLVDKNLSHIYFTEEDKSKSIIIDKFSTKKNKSECLHRNINKQKEANNEAEYKESSVTDEVPSYFNIFGCDRNLLNRLDGTYERACMATQEEK